MKRMLLGLGIVLLTASAWLGGCSKSKSSGGGGATKTDGGNVDGAAGEGGALPDGGGVGDGHLGALLDQRRGADAAGPAAGDDDAHAHRRAGRLIGRPER